jgi:uncharacterized protein YjbI with pentapeptide repeats
LGLDGIANHPYLPGWWCVFLNQQPRRSERALSKDRIREGSLQNYLNEMSDLLLENSDLKNSEPEAVVRDVARARTLTTLSGLNGRRKGDLLRFLYESGLIDKENVIVDLAGADFRKAYMSEVYQRTAFLWGGYQWGSELQRANLQGADLTGADLTGARLWESNLYKANMNGAFLVGADLNRADLRFANLRGAFLFRASLWGTNMAEANLRGAILTFATYDDNTIWPTDFDPEKKGARKKAPH